MKKIYILLSISALTILFTLRLTAQNRPLFVDRQAEVLNITATSPTWNPALVQGPTIPQHVKRALQLEQSSTPASSNARRGRTAACGPDTVQFTTARATGLTALNINNASSAQAMSQYFNAPQTLTVDGFDFFAYKINQTGGITINVSCEIYLAGPDSMPSGAALASVMVPVDTSFFGGDIDSLRKHASFTTPITISQPYVLVFGNYTANQVGLLFNDYNVQDGQQSWLAGVDLFGTYTRPYNVTVGSNVFDADALFHPHVSYDLTTDFTPDIACLDMDTTTITFANASSPILFDEMYNQSLFAGLNISSTYDFGDASAMVQDTAPSHLYTAAGAYDVTRTDTLFGWTSTCIDMKTITLEGNDLVCPGNTTAPYGSLPDYTNLTIDTCVGQSVTQSPLPGTPYNMTTTVTLTLGSQSCMFDVSAPFSGIVYFEDFQGIGSAPVSVVSTVTGGPMTTYNVDGLTPDASVAYVTDAWIAREDFISDPADTVAFSTSWYSPAGTANDWMVTPQISLPASTAQLSWDELAPDGAFPDGYEVRVSTRGNAVGDFTNLIYSNGAAEQTWTTRTISLTGYENQDIYIAFRNNSIDQFLLLIDDILVFAPPSGVDLALDSAANPLGEYYATTLNQFTGCNFDLFAKVENNSSENATNVMATCHILVDGNPTPVASIASDIIGALPAFNSDSITFTNTFSPTLEGDYTLVYVVSSDSTDFDPINDTTRVSCKIAPNYMARDNEVITSSLGIGGNSMGVLGQNFTLKAPDNIEAISFYKGPGGAGDTISAVLYHTDMTTGKPTTLIASTVLDTIQVTDTLNFMTLEFPIPISLAAGTYYIGVNEFQENIALGTATDIFTPGTTWIDWPSNPFGDWTNNEDFGPQFALSFVLRPIFGEGFNLSCPSKHTTPYDTIGDYTALATWTCAGPVMQSPTSGTPFMDSVMVTLMADTFDCSFMVYHVNCELLCPGDQLDSGATILMDYTPMVMWNCPGSVTQSPVPGSAVTDGMEVTMMADTFTCTFRVYTNELPKTLPYCEDFDSSPVDDVNFGPGAEPFPVATNGLFDNGWLNVQSDAATQDWYGRSIATGSSSTGPSVDHTSGGGVYMFVEDGFGNFTDVTLESPLLDLTSPDGIELNYWAHSQTAATSSFNYMLVQVDTNGTWTTVDSFAKLSGTDTWFYRTVELNGFVNQLAKIRFVCNNSFQSFEHDIAIDDVCVVSTALTVVLDVTDNALCSGDANGTATALVTYGQGPYTYQWSRNNADTNFISGITAGPISVTVTDNLGDVVMATDTIKDLNEPIMLYTTIIPTVCYDDVYIDTITGGFTELPCSVNNEPCDNPSFDTLGTDTFFPGNTVYPAPFGNWYWGARHQFIYTASELQGMGIEAGLITSMAYDVATMDGGATADYQNLQIQMGCTDLDNLSTDWIGGLSEVRAADSFIVSLGWNQINFDQGYYWDGLSNLVVEVCFNNVGFTRNSSTRSTDAGFTACRWYRADNSTVCSSSTTTGTSSLRPNTLFGHCDFNIQPYDILWSTGSTSDNIKLDSAGDYYVTITDGNGCQLVDTISSTNNGDVDPPVPLCAFNIPLHLESDGMLTLKAEDLDVAAYDNCTAPEDLRFSFSSTDVNDTLRTLTCANLGAGTILTYVFDEKDLWSPCSASYMLSDTFAPTPSCASISVYLDDLGMYMLSETDSAAMVSATIEACGSFTSTFSRASFSCLDIATPADVTITYADGSNNTSSCMATVTVLDTLPPMAVCNEISVYVDANGDYVLTSVDSQAIVSGGSDNCELMTATLVPMSFNCAGSDQVTVTYTDSYSNTSMCQATITLLDTFAPIQDCFNFITVYLDSTGQYTISAADSATLVGTTTDVCDGDGFTTTFSQVDFDCNDIINPFASRGGCGGVSVIVTVTDSSNNSSSCSSCVQVLDTFAPAAMCHDITVALDGAGNYTLSEADSMALIAGTFDNCGPFTVALSQRSFDCGDVGNISTIMITFEDSRGNTSTCQPTVTVLDQTAPVIVCENLNVLLNASGVYTLPASFLLSGSSFDGCGGPLTASFSSTNMNVNFMTIDCSFVGPVPTDVPVYVWDESGNMASCIAGVKADDNITPTAVCHDITVTLNMDGTYQLTPADSSAMTAGSTDNCLDFIASFSQRDFDCADEGTHTIDITIADNDGNSDMCSANITIERPTTLLFTWVGLVSTAWNVGGNWDNGCVPGEFDDVLIKSSPNNPVISSGQVFKIRTLEVETGAELFCDGELTVEN